MKIYDEKNNLLSIVIKADEINERINFVTSNEEEMQVASFNFSQDTVIDNHIHLNQNRNIHTTPEIIFVVKGFVKVSLFDDQQNFIKEVELTSGDTIAFLRGGHGLVVKEGTKLVEAKQGPYIENLDKKRF